MTDYGWSSELDAAVEAVAEAGKIAHEQFCTGFSGIEDKADKTPVSKADRDAEHQMARLLHNRFPQDTVIGEESALRGNPLEGRVWLLDPIDGTSNAITGVNPLFMCQACLIVDGDPVVAALASPITGQLFTAVRRRGAFLHVTGRKVRLRVSHQTDLSRARVLVGMGAAQEDGQWLAGVYSRLLALGNPSSPRHFGSSSFDLCLVAAGGLSQRGVDAKIDCGSNSWDLAPGVLLVLESGGIALDSAGSAWNTRSGSLVAGASEVVQLILAKLCEDSQR